LATILKGIEARVKRDSERVIRTSRNNVLQDMAKRAFDIFAAFVGLIILVPLFAFVTLLINRDSEGPVLFWCPRMGKNGRPFRMVKFRTMIDNPNGLEGLPVTCKDDERITQIGHWLRDTKINELPQLWNVFIGEMSLVGPRPEDIGIANGWPEDAREEILSVRPGITSPASILYHDEEDQLTRENVMGEYFKNILPDKLRLDRLYVRNRSLSTDLDLLFWTLIIIIPRAAKAKIPEGYLFAGPFYRLVNRYLSWFVTDLIISFMTVGLLGILWRLQEPLNWGFTHLTALAVFIAFVFSGVNSIVGLNRILWDRATVEDALSLCLSGAGVTLSLLLIDYLQNIFHWFSMPALPVVMIVAIGLMSQAGFIVARFRLRIFTSFASRWLKWRDTAQKTGERVVIIGGGEGYQIANWLLKRGELRYIFSIVGLVDDDLLTLQGMRLEGCVVLGRTTDLPHIMEKYDVGVILITTSKIASEAKEYVFGLCQSSDVRIAYIDNIIESMQEQLTRPINSLENSLRTDDHQSYLALHDLVTGLPNRFLFQDQLLRSIAYAKRYKTSPVILFISLSGLQSVNNPSERKIHDTVLKELAKRLLKYKRESDTLARIDDTRFGMILEKIDDESVIPIVANRISRIISEPIELHGNMLYLDADIVYCKDLNGYTPSEIADVRKLYNQGVMVLSPIEPENRLISWPSAD
jgi:diguanylate cyclase (GGDEF)-like protein